MTWSLEEWFDSNHSLRVASATLAAFIESNAGIPIAPQNNAKNFTLKTFSKQLL